MYTVSEMAKKLGVAPSTLRYYDKEGLLPFVKRSAGGIRQFSEADREWLQMIECLKKTGMQLRDIRAFLEMAMQGDETVAPRLALISQQKEAVAEKIRELSDTLRVLEFKEWYYRTAQKYGSTAAVRDLPLCEIPAEFHAVWQRLRGAENAE